ncbi:flippase [Candidatus Aerophobetes bacterium]|nr:flippase [Candidatus Aerophobetes bacterium]
MKSEALDTSLKKIAKGTGIVLTGTILGMLLGLVSRIVIVRYVTPSEFGLLYLSLTITGITATIACLGFPVATVRYVAFYLETKDTAKVREVIKTSLVVSSIISITLFLFIFFFAHRLASLFNEPQLVPVIKIMSFIIPARALVSVLVSILRGFEDVKSKIYFHDIFPYITKLPLLGIVVLLGFAFRGVVYASLISFLAVAMLAGIYSLKKVVPHIKGRQARSSSSEKALLRRELVFFALPLFVTIILQLIISSTDTLMLGYFRSARVVGFYNVAHPIANYIAVILGASAFIYFPIATALHAQNLTSELKQMYQITTKWVFTLTLPLFLLAFLVPDSTLYFLFGTQYLQAATALRILSLGFFLHTFLGLNIQTLIVFGKARYVMLNNLMVAGLNVILNLQLIPRFGLEGAAFASAVSLILGNILASVELYKISGIHPFTRNYFKPIALSIPLAIICYFMGNFIKSIHLQVILLGLSFTAVSLLSIIITRSVEREDLMILRSTQQKLGINLPLAESALKKIIGKQK